MHLIGLQLVILSSMLSLSGYEVSFVLQLIGLKLNNNHHLGLNDVLLYLRNILTITRCTFFRSNYVCYMLWYPMSIEKEGLMRFKKYSLMLYLLVIKTTTICKKWKRHLDKRKWYLLHANVWHDWWGGAHEYLKIGETLSMLMGWCPIINYPYECLCLYACMYICRHGLWRT